MYKARAKGGGEFVASWLSWEYSLTLIDYHQARAKQEKILDDSQETFEQVQIRREFQAKGEWEFAELSSSFGPGLKIIRMCCFKNQKPALPVLPG